MSNWTPPLIVAAVNQPNLVDEVRNQFDERVMVFGYNITRNCLNTEAIATLVRTATEGFPPECRVIMTLNIEATDCLAPFTDAGLKINLLTTK